MAQASSLSLVRFDGNDYSVPTAYAHHPVTVVGGLDEVRLVCRDHLVARHRRHGGKEHVAFDPVHYLALLERKPGAFDFARPLAGWELPEAFAVLRRRFEAVWGEVGVRHFIQVLRLMEKCSLDELTAAVERALAIGATTADAVRVLLEVTREAPGRVVPTRRSAPPGRGERAPARPHGLPRPTRRGWVVKKTETTSTVLLKHHLKALRLPTVLAECEKVAQQCATDNADHLAFLLQLTELELLDRERRAAERRLKAARFPTLKTLEDFDFAAQPSLNKVLVAELMRCEFLDKRESVILIGSPGTGKPRPA